VEKSVRRGFLRRLASVLAFALATGLVQASSCNDNLGHVHPGPVNFRVSVGRDSTQANGASFSPSISGDGQFVVFASDAKNLALPTSAFREIYLRDRQNDTVRNVTRLINSRNTTGIADCDFPFISRSGKFIVFTTKGDFTSNSPTAVNTTLSAFRWDVDNDVFDPVCFTWPNSDVTNVSISDDGKFVVFQTAAGNLGIANGSEHVFLADFTGGSPPAISLVSKAMAPAPPSQPCNNLATQPRISADGQSIVFQSMATDLTADPTNGKFQVFFAARNGSSMTLVSRADGAAGATADFDCLAPNLSGDGRYVVFTYAAPNGGGTLLAGGPTGPRVVRRDRNPAAPALATTVNAGGPNPFIFSFFSNFALPPCISDDGQFASSWYFILDSMGNFVDLKVGVQDLAGSFSDASQGIIGTSGATLGTFPLFQMSADGRWIVFMSLSDTQVVGDTNAAADIFGYGPIH
jgi:Tol biopolymer transport system component